MADERLRILFAGGGAFGLPTLRALQERHDVVRVYTQPDRPAGRGKKLTPTPIGREVPDAVRTPRFDDEDLPDADALIVIAFGQKIGQHQANAPRLGSLNLHASRLPKYRGAAPIHHALLDGESLVGNSVIRLAEQMDAGDVLGMSELPVEPNETTGELHDRLATDGPALVLRVLDELAGGRAIETPQDHSRATKAPKLSRADAVLDFEQDAERLANKINALSPWPGCRVTIAGQTLTLLRATVAEGATSAAPGTLQPDGHLATGRGLLRILDLQPQGGRPMPIAAYLNGRDWPAGEVVKSIG
jgi:methionyl-tRNA formyltransferase